MVSIQTIQNQNQLKALFQFFARTFYEDANNHHEHYFTMGDRYEEMRKQFCMDPDLLMYIEEDGKIIAGLTGKGMDLEHKKITLSVLAVDSNYRRKGYAKELINEFEKRCIKKGIKHLDLGARFRACPIYLSLGYQPSLMVQVFDFVSIDDVRKENQFHLKEKSSWQSDVYGFIFFEVDEVKESYIQWFEQHVKTAHAQYIFEKDLF